MRNLKKTHIDPIITDLRNQNEFLKSECKHLQKEISELKDELSKWRSWSTTFVITHDDPEVSYKPRKEVKR